MASIFYDEPCSALVFSEKNDIPSSSNIFKLESICTGIDAVLYPKLDPEIEIICVTLSGKEIKLTIDKSSTILNLKKNVYKKTDIMIDDQHFVYNGKTLNDSKTIHSYNITNGSRINMILQIKAGVYNIPKGFISLNYYIKFQRCIRMIECLRKYCKTQDILDDFELKLYTSDNDEEIDRLYNIIESVYIKL